MTASTTAAIQVRGLRKTFNKTVVLDAIAFEVPQGTVFALLGANGAGKTTTVHILTTLLLPDAGELRVAGADPIREADAVRHAIGLTGQVSAVDKQFTGRENLQLMADLSHLGRNEGRRRVDELIDLFAIGEVVDRPAMTYSGGERRRLDLAMTLVSRPRILFLDEPTTGLDPRSRRVMWEIVRDLVADGVTVFLTTQYLEEADQLAHRIAMLDHGRIVAQGTPAELKRLVPGGRIRLEFGDVSALERAASVLAIDDLDREALALSVSNEGGGTQPLRSVLDRLDAASIEAASVSVETADLDDVFLSLTGREAHEKVATR